MRAVPINCIPEAKRYHRLQAFLEEFVNSNVGFAKIELAPDEYESPLIAYRCIGLAAKRGNHPVKVIKRGNDLYLVRTDM